MGVSGANKSSKFSCHEDADASEDDASLWSAKTADSSIGLVEEAKSGTAVVRSEVPGEVLLDWTDVDDGHGLLA